MCKIKIEKPDKQKLEKLGVGSWPIWEKSVSRFPWTYDSEETCYILEGQVRIEQENDKPVEFGKGDLVTFPSGLSCTWEIKEDVRKHYRFM